MKKAVLFIDKTNGFICWDRTNNTKDVPYENVEFPNNGKSYDVVYTIDGEKYKEYHKKNDHRLYLRKWRETR